MNYSLFVFIMGLMEEDADYGDLREGHEPFSSLDDYISGLEVDLPFLVSLESRAQRQAFVHALAELSWEGLEDLDVTLAELFSADPGWLADVQDVFIHTPALWGHIKAWDTVTLANVGLTAQSSSSGASFLSEIEHLLELRREALHCPDAQQFFARMEVVRTLSVH